MSSTASNRVLSLYKSRKTILDLLEYNEYDVSDYTGFNINEIDAMYVNTQLDMLIKHATNGTNVYIKYCFSPKSANGQIRPQHLRDIIEDLYEIESVLSKSDTLIVIINDEPNETIITLLKYLYDHDGIFVIIHNIKRLQFNILEHKLIPSVHVLNAEETEIVKKSFNLRNVQQLPEISRFDPLALAICMRPGQICKIIRKSSTAMLTNFYRVCV